MRSLALLGVAAIAAALQQPLGAGEMAKPIMVSSLSDSNPAPAAPVPAPAAAPAAAVRPAESSFALDKLQKSVKAQQSTLELLSKQLEEGLRQKQRLQLAQRLMTAIVSLKKAERVLGRIDAAVVKYKSSVKKLGSDADEIADAIKRSEAEHKRELVELSGKLDGLKRTLGKASKKVAKLATRRTKVKDILKKWKKHVATLRDAHEALQANSNARRSGGLADLQAPPSADRVLSELGIPRAAPGDSFLRGAIAPSDRRRALDKLVDSEKVTASAADAAAAEVYRATVKELGGKRNLPAFAQERQDAQEGVAQPRFAAAQEDAEADADGESDAKTEAQEDAELDAEVGMDLEEPPAEAGF